MFREITMTLKTANNNTDNQYTIIVIFNAHQLFFLVIVSEKKALFLYSFAFFPSQCPVFKHSGEKFHSCLNWSVLFVRCWHGTIIGNGAKTASLNLFRFLIGPIILNKMLIDSIAQETRAQFEYFGPVHTAQLYFYG